ncbi:uL30 family ribosomal protein [Candidatus Woesearchaeota archaeon]|nr:uL30 family ribosomal protein [Candidatus Woesearchaeota archaeon]
MKIAVVRVRGLVRVKTPVQETMRHLRLMNRNYCVFLDPTPQNRGMVRRVRDYVTWGEVDDGFFAEVAEKKGDAYTGREQDAKGKISYSRRYHIVNGKKIRKYFRLNPPRGGYGRKGVKAPFSLGGALGDRKEKIVSLIRRMM